MIGIFRQLLSAILCFQLLSRLFAPTTFGILL